MKERLESMKKVLTERLLVSGDLYYDYDKYAADRLRLERINNLLNKRVKNGNRTRS